MTITNCAIRSWPAPRKAYIKLSDCAPARAGEGGATSSWYVEMYPLNCSADDPTGAIDIIDCVLFQRWKWEQLKPQLAALISTPPPFITIEESSPTLSAWLDPASRTNPQVIARMQQLMQKAQVILDWFIRVTDMVEQMLSATNIQSPFLLGGVVPTSFTDVTNRIRSADPVIWPRLASTLASWPVASNRIYFPEFRGKVGQIPGLTAPSPYARIGLLPFYPEDFGMFSDFGPEGQRDGWPNVVNSVVSAPPARSVQGHPNTAYLANMKDRTLVYMMGSAPWYVGTATIAGQRVDVRMPGPSKLLELWQAAVTDMLTTPYERFVMFGVQKWSDIMAQWAASGNLNKAAGEFTDLARRAQTVNAQIGTTAALGSGGGIAAAAVAGANPVAGAAAAAVVGVLGAVSGLLFSLGVAAVGGWQCPPPLMRRMADGLCNFSQILGAGAVDRVVATVQNVATRVTTQAAQQAQATAETAAAAQRAAPMSAGAKVAVVLGIVAAAGAGYYLLKD